MATTKNETKYVLSGINGPAYASALFLEFVLAFIPNLFIIIYTMFHCALLKQPSMIFLTGLALVNLLSSSLFIPFTIVTASVGEWVFGGTTEEKDGVCQFVGFMFTFTVGISVHLLAMISFDRFLLIVKPFVYRRYITPRTVFVSICVMCVYVALQDIAPFLGLGRYDFVPGLASCGPVYIGEEMYVAYFSAFRLVPIIVIVVTSIWTCCFTHSFLARTKNQTNEGLTSPTYTQQNQVDNVYSKRVCFLFGIFGMLILVLVLSFLPYISISVVGIIIKFQNIPIPVLSAAPILFFMSYIANPIIQIYFRRDLSSFIAKKIKRINKYCWK